MQVRPKFVKALTLSICAHLLLLVLISVHYKKATISLPEQPPSPVINSYIYQPPMVTVPEPEIIISPTEEPLREVEVIEQARVIEPIPAPIEPTANPEKPLPIANKQQAQQIPPKIVTPRSQPFNPYQGFNQVLKQQEQQWLNEQVQQAQSQRGHSIMQASPEVVPKRKVELTAEQKRRQNTSQVGNETITKQNGVCQQVTDLSFIDDNLPKVASYSDCGETDEERYFREFMQKRMARYKKPSDNPPL